MMQTHVLPAKSSPTPRFSGGAGNGAASDQKPARHRGNIANLVALLMEEKPTPQLPLDFYSGPPDPGDRFYMAFTLDTPEEEAAAAFLRRYGSNPEFVFESRGLLLCGPIPSEVLL